MINESISGNQLLIMSLCQQIEELESRLLLSDGQKDLAFIEQVLAEDFEELGPSGKSIGRQDVIDWLLFHNAQVKWALHEFRIKPISEQTVIAIYRADKEDLQGKTVSKTWHSSIWQYTDPLWQMIFHQQLKK